MVTVPKPMVLSQGTIKYNSSYAIIKADNPI